ncbi:MAG: hypothetical protein J6Y94_02165, partial [Bacteriovoracaceae bacterium]|nr:hypothetical protein [Bacteriovoracaceae bacterium]
EAPATTDGDVINSGVGVTRSGNNVYGSAVNLGAGSKIDCMSTTSSGACANYNDLIANAQKESEANDSGEVEGISIDPAIMSATNALGDGINGVQGNSKISGETLGKFAQVAASQGAARSFLDNVRQKLNSVLKDNGEEEIDFAKQEQQAVKEMQDNVSKELQSRGVDLPSEVGKGTFGPSYQQELKDAKPSTAPVTAMAGSYHPKTNVTKNSKRKVRDLVTGVHDGSALKDNTKVDDLNMGDTSINDEDGPSLFEILQHRHRQYWPILFQSSK